MPPLHSLLLVLLFFPTLIEGNDAQLTASASASAATSTAATNAAVISSLTASTAATLGAALAQIANGAHLAATSSYAATTQITAAASSASTASTASSSSAHATQTTSASTNAANGVNLSSQSTSLSTLLTTSATSGTSSDAVLSTAITSALSTSTASLLSSASTATLADVATSSTGSTTAVAARGTLSSAETALSTATSNGATSTSSATSAAASSSTLLVSQTTAAASNAATTTAAALASTSRASTAASTTGGKLFKPQRCSPYIICSPEAQGVSQTWLGFWGQAPHGAGLTNLEVASVNINKATSSQATVFTSLPNQQDGLECDFYQSAILWDIVGSFCSGYTQRLTPIYSESNFISNAVYCLPAYQPITTGELPIQIIYTHQVGNTLQITRVRNVTQLTYDENPIVVMPVGDGSVTELTRYRTHVMAQQYMNLICSLRYTSEIQFITNYTTYSNNIWDSVGIRCTNNDKGGIGQGHSYLQLVDAGDQYNLTVSSVLATSSGTNTAAVQLILASLQKNYYYLGETVFFGHSLQTLAASLMCAYQGRLIRICNDCRL